MLAASVIRFAQKADGWLGIMLHIHHICIISTLGRQIFVRSRPARTPCETLPPKPNQLLLGIKRWPGCALFYNTPTLCKIVGFQTVPCPERTHFTRSFGLSFECNHKDGVTTYFVGHVNTSICLLSFTKQISNLSLKVGQVQPTIYQNELRVYQKTGVLTSHKNSQTRAGVTAQSVKDLQSKQQDLTLIPRIQVREARRGAGTCNPIAGEVEAGRSLVLNGQQV